MRITPHDIRQQQFTVRMFKGFDPQEVDAFLEDVADEYESLLKECQLLKEQIAAQEERQRGVLEREKVLQDTLVTTQRLCDEMKSGAKREADLIVREAELRGDKAVEAARGEEARIRVEIQTIKRMRRQLVEDLATTVERMGRELLGDLGATVERYQRMLGAQAAEDSDGA